MNDAPAATEALVAAVSGRPGGRATELAVAYLRLARRPTFGAESGAPSNRADGGSPPVRDVLNALSWEERRLVADAIHAVLDEQGSQGRDPRHDDEMVSGSRG